MSPVRPVGMFVIAALCVAVMSIVVLAFLSDSANAFKILPGDNVQQSPVAGSPQCSDLFAGSSQVRLDAPGENLNPTGTVPPVHVAPVTFTYSDSNHHVAVTIEGWNDLVGVIVHGDTSGARTGSNVYDVNTGVSGRLIATLNPGGGLDVILYTLACYVPHEEMTSTTTVAAVAPTTTAAAPTTTAATVVPPTSTVSGSGSTVTTTTVAVVTTTAPTVVLPEVEQAQPAQPVPGQPSFTG